MLDILEQVMLIDSDEFLVFETGFWWFSKNKYQKSGDHRNLYEIIGQYTWFLENELNIKIRISCGNGWMSEKILIQASDESLTMLKLMIV